MTKDRPMIQVYYTSDFNGHNIEENATIQAAAGDTLEEAQEAALKDLAQAYTLDNNEQLNLIAGNFADCWIKDHQEPIMDGLALDDVIADDLIIARPGTHPGGNVWWITPSPQVYVAELGPNTPVVATSEYLNHPLRTLEDAMEDIIFRPRRRAFFKKFPRLASVGGTVYKDTYQEWSCECCGADVHGQEANRIAQYSSFGHTVQCVLHTCQKCWEALL